MDVSIHNKYMEENRGKKPSGVPTPREKEPYGFRQKPGVVIKKEGAAGKAEKDDIFVVVKPREKREGVNIMLSSKVMKIYGDKIVETIKKKLGELGVDDVYLEADDRGALDYVIRARVEAAIRRAEK